MWSQSSNGTYSTEIGASLSWTSNEDLYFWNHLKTSKMHNLKTEETKKIWVKPWIKFHKIYRFVNPNGPHYPRRIKGAKETLPKIYLPPRLTHQKSFSSWSHVALRALRTLWKKSIKWLFANKRISQRGEGGRRPSHCLVTWSTCRARRLSYEVQSDCGVWALEWRH